MSPLLLSAALAAPMAPAVSHDALGAGPDADGWHVALNLGFPTQALTARVGLSERWWCATEASAALVADGWALVGVGMAWVDRPGLRIGGEALLGAHGRRGELAMRGPAADLRIRAARGQGRLVPYALVETRHTLLLDRTVVESATTTDSAWSLSHRWSPLASAGLGVALSPSVGLDVGLDVPWLDPPGFTIPGFHVGLQVGR